MENATEPRRPKGADHRGRRGWRLSELAVDSGRAEGVRRNPDKDRVVTGLGHEASDHTGGLATMADPTGRR